jgi:hypothetical protein
MEGPGYASSPSLAPNLTLCWRHIYGSSKTSHCDLPLDPALSLLPLLQLILPSELCIARGFFPLTCRRGPHVAAAHTHPSSSIVFGTPTRPRTISPRSCDGTLHLQSVQENCSGLIAILREPPVTAETPGANQKKYVLPPAATRVRARYRTRGRPAHCQQTARPGSRQRALEPHRHHCSVSKSAGHPKY